MHGHACIAHRIAECLWHHSNGSGGINMHKELNAHNSMYMLNINSLRFQQKLEQKWADHRRSINCIIKHLLGFLGSRYSCRTRQFLQLLSYLWRASDVAHQSADDGLFWRCWVVTKAKLRHEIHEESVAPLLVLVVLLQVLSAKKPVIWN